MDQYDYGGGRRMVEERLIAFGYPDTPRDPEVDAFIRDFVAQESMPARIDEWVAKVADYVVQGAPELAGDAELAQLMLDTAREQWTTFMQTVLAAEDILEAHFVMVPTAALLAVEAARKRLDLSILVNAYRMAQRAAWDYATGIVAQLPAHLDHAGLLIRFWTAAGAWLDAALERSILMHQTETRRIQQRGDAQRLDLVRRVLDGDAVEPRELSAGLGGYPVSGDHVALILVADSADSIGQLDTAAVRLAERLGARAMVVQPGGRELWCWVPGADNSRLATLTSVELPAGVRAVAGGPHRGTDGFVTAFEDARRAQRVPSRPGGPAVMTYDEVAAVALLSSDPASEAYVRRTLGKLASDELAVVRLRETVAAYIANAGSVATVADQLGLHKNTVRYRLDQAERLLPAPLDGRAAVIGLAIAYYDALLAAFE